MRTSSITRGVALALGAALTVGGLAQPVRASTDVPVVLILMENHAYGATDPTVGGATTKYVVGNATDAPYLNGTLIPSGTLFTNHHAASHPSLPNYLELTAGTNAGCVVDSCARDSIASENLFHLLGQAGHSFASLSESMPANCSLSNVAPYLVRHNPEVYFTNVDAVTGLPYDCPVTDRTIASASPGTALAWPNPLPDFSFVTPNYCDDMHGSPATGTCPSGTDQIIKDGDTWLAANVPALLALGAVVIVTFDEGASGDTTGGGGHVATVMAGPGVSSGASDATSYTHASLLAGLEEYFSLAPLIADAATATPLRIPRATPYPPAISSLTPETGVVGDQVTIAGTGLANAYSVQFAGTPASFSVTSDTSITASVPAGALTGTVTVSTIGGTATSTDPFTVEAGSAPPALVQHAVGSGTTSNHPNVAWPQTTVAADLQIATLGWSGSTTVTPPAGWALAVVAGGTAIYYRQNAPSVSGATTFSLSSNVNWVLSVSEWSGMAVSGAFDKKAHAASSTIGSSASSGTTAVTSQPVELAVAGLRALANVTESGPTNGFTQLDQRAAGAKDTLGVYDLVTAAAAARSTSVTLSVAANWRGVIATFRGA